MKLLWKNYKRNKNCGKLLNNLNRSISGYKNINYKQLIEMKKESSRTIILDVRSVQEYNEGHINGAILIPLFELDQKAEQILKNKKQTIIVYCKSGIRSIKAIEILIKKGYTNLYNLDGGIENC